MERVVIEIVVTTFTILSTEANQVPTRKVWFTHTVQDGIYWKNRNEEGRRLACHLLVVARAAKVGSAQMALQRRSQVLLRAHDNRNAERGLARVGSAQLLCPTRPLWTTHLLSACEREPTRLFRQWSPEHACFVKSTKLDK